MIDGEDGADALTGEQLIADATRAALYLRNLGVQPGDHVACVGRTSAAHVTLIVAVLLAGAAVAELPVPTATGTRFGASALGEQLRTIRPSITLADRHSLEFVQGPHAGLVADIDSFLFESRHTAASRTGTPSPSGDSAAVLQLTSGTTGQPQALSISHAALTASVTGMSTRAQL